MRTLHTGSNFAMNSYFCTSNLILAHKLLCLLSLSTPAYASLCLLCKRQIMRKLPAYPRSHSWEYTFISTWYICKTGKLICVLTSIPKQYPNDVTPSGLRIFFPYPPTNLMRESTNFWLPKLLFSAGSILTHKLLLQYSSHSELHLFLLLRIITSIYYLSVTCLH